MVTATGLGSGLDINTLVTAIVDAERAPLIARVDAKKADIDNLVSGYGSLQTAMAAVRDSVAKLADATQLNATSATSSQNISCKYYGGFNRTNRNLQPFSFPIGAASITH
jgi:flagellar hook-associated protein 2